ncbi:GNAT family N-acetyltransferase [Polaromonas sp.]|uniref:GNAT family N-acetyltransferase n=1 Tax=Polaromonas sp. TaxID=1869339 RepID=UPI0032649FE7
MEIRIDDLRGAGIAALLQIHLDAMHEHSPPESVHALDLDALRHPSITFWTACEGEELMGCGALKQLTPMHAELKSMRTAADHVQKGVARALLRHIEAAARAKGIRQISLKPVLTLLLLQHKSCIEVKALWSAVPLPTMCSTPTACS